MNSSTKTVSPIELSKVFLKLGFFGFGGPAAHVAMMQQEVVEKRSWLTQEEFMDLWGASQLIPGPNSTELAIHVGYKLGKWKGLLLAGLSFIMPAFFLVLVLAIFYQQFSYQGKLESIMRGIRPVILMIILDALWAFRKKALKDGSTWFIAIFALILTYLGAHEVLLILGVGLGYACFFPGRMNGLFLFPVAISKFVFAPLTSSSLFWSFFKIGSVLFGSGYVLLSFLQSEFVDENMWLTQGQLLDAITVGQVTPGPVFTTATFIGYILKSYEGAVVATLGIFFPSFILVALTAKTFHRLLENQFFRKFLDGVNAVSLALLVKVTLDLGRMSLFSVPTFLIAIISIVILLRFKQISNVWLLLASGILGFIFL